MRSLCSGLIAAAIFSAVSVAMPASAATESVIYSFKYSKFGCPVARLLWLDGSLFGTGAGCTGNGQVFELTPTSGSWKETSIWKFGGADGSGPAGGLITDSSGTLYGTTLKGGASNNGTVFSLSFSGGKWTEQVLYSFAGGSDGANPVTDLIMDSTGTIYGTTTEGGAFSGGTVFTLSSSGGVWSEQVLYSFGSGSDGKYPYGGVHMDKAGALYGATANGDALNGGTVFELTPAGGTWTEKILYSFTGGSDGGQPNGSLIEDASGALYGTTTLGGANGDGTVFQLVQSGGVWSENVLHSFDACCDGIGPLAGLHRSKTGAFYATTQRGGKIGSGTVVEVKKSGGVWVATVLHSFGKGLDGQAPFSAVISGANGALYGTTEVGGKYGFYGTVFRVTP